MLSHRFKWTIASITVAIILSLSVGAQIAREEKVDLDVVAKIKAEGNTDRSQVMETLSYLTDIYGPRLTNSPQYKAACEWAKNKLTEWGLQNAHLEAWGPFGRGWSLERFSADIVKPDYFPLIAYPKAWSPSTNGPVRGGVIYLDAKTENDLDKYRGKLKGAIVLISPLREVTAHFQPEGKRKTDEELLDLANSDGRFQPRRGQRGTDPLTAKKWALVYDESAAIVLEAGRGDGGTIFVQGATLPSAIDTSFDRRPRPWLPNTKVLPQLVLAVEHYNRIVRMVTKGVPVELEIKIDAKYHEQDLMSYNVIAEIPGTDLKDEIVMVGGHFDSWHSGTGATDNAAGSAVAMEVVRIIQTLGLKPRRTVRIGLWGGEEQGLNGSRAHVAKYYGERKTLPGQPTTRPQSEEQEGQGQNRPQGPVVLKPDHSKFSVYFNLDNGTGKIRGVYMQGNEAVRPIFRSWLAPFRELGAATLSISNTSGTDHLSFDAVGLPGFQFIQDEIEYNSRTHHSNMDVYDRIQADDMKQASVIIASFVYHAAMRNEKIPRKPLPGQEQAAR